MKKEGLNPIINNNTEILILGTMPGDISIKTGEYYANTKNQFWNIIFKLFNDEHIEHYYEEKTKLLLRNKIGLWDVLTKADRLGSSDSNIHKEELNNFVELFKNYPNIKTVVFNGKKAMDYFKGIESIPQDKNYYILPSTSSSNTWKTIKQKYQEWTELLKPNLAT